MRHLYVLYLAIQGLLEGIQPDSPEWLLEHFENAQQLLETLENECVSEEETADEAGSVVAYLKEHFREDLSLDAVARALYMSNSSVRRVLMPGMQRYLSTLFGDVAHGAGARFAEAKRK